MKQHNPEVLIYLNGIKKFIEANKEARDYFVTSIDPEVFYEKVAEYADKNYEENGAPELSQVEFEKIRQEIGPAKPSGVKLFFNGFSLN
jgi:hypothetical protein